MSRFGCVTNKKVSDGLPGMKTCRRGQRLCDVNRLTKKSRRQVDWWVIIRSVTNVPWTSLIASERLLASGEGQLSSRSYVPELNLPTVPAFRGALGIEHGTTRLDWLDWSQVSHHFPLTKRRAFLGTAYNTLSRTSNPLLVGYPKNTVTSYKCLGRGNQIISIVALTI